MNYPYIRAWSRYLGYSEMSAELEIVQAQKDNAPARAIGYEASDDLWLTVDDIQDSQVKQIIVSLAKELENDLH